MRPSILWSIAHRQGVKLPTKNFWEFEDMITMTGGEKNRSLKEMNDRFFHWTELIQSSPEAIEESVKAVIDGGYRRSNITLHELRFNPMKRNRGGERDLDLIIMSALWGMDQALLEYPQVKAGIILMMDGTFPKGLNEIILAKAIKYRNRGVIGSISRVRTARGSPCAATRPCSRRRAAPASASRSIPERRTSSTRCVTS